MADPTVDALLVHALSEAGLPSIVRELVRVVPGPAGAVNDHSLITLVDAERNRLACELAFMLYKAAARAAVAARGGHSTNAPWVAQAVEQYVRSLPDRLTTLTAALA